MQLCVQKTDPRAVIPTRSTEGSGLGLSIANSLTALQKGHLALSTDGDLFKVTLTFPLA